MPERQLLQPRTFTLKNASLRMHLGRKNDVRPLARVHSFLNITKAEKASGAHQGSVFLNNISRKCFYSTNNTCIFTSGPLKFSKLSWILTWYCTVQFLLSALNSWQPQGRYLEKASCGHQGQSPSVRKWGSSLLWFKVSYTEGNLSSLFLSYLEMGKSPTC